MKHSDSWRRWLLALMFLGVSLLALTAHAQVNATGRRLALVMGNDAYQNVHKLERAGNDAAAMARELKAAGFDVTLERDLNYRSMVKKVDFFTSHITGGDQVVIFFAGHGVQLRSGSYLLPTDIEANSESEVEKTAIALSDVLDKLNDAKASFALVMIDACRDNPLKSGGRSLGASRGLLPPDPPKGQMVVYSASKGQQALDKLGPKDNNRNGVFTREFIARMRKPGVRIEDLVREVQDSVEDLAKSIGHDQRPAFYNEARGNFYFYGQTTVQVNSSGALATGLSDAEASLWQAVSASNSVDEYAVYIQQYPGGRYLPLAILRAKKLMDEANAKAQVEEADAWQSAQKGGSKEIALYLEHYPNGIHAKEANALVDKLKADQSNMKVDNNAKGRIGVQIDVVSVDVAAAIGLNSAKGALVRSVEEGASAQIAGVEAGDVVTQFNRAPINKSSDLPPLVSATPIGTNAIISVFRRGKLFDLPILVGSTAQAKAPIDASRRTKQSTPVVTESSELNSSSDVKYQTAYSSIYGLKVSEMTETQRNLFGLKYGLRVEEATGISARAGLKEGDFILAIRNEILYDIRKFESSISNVGDIDLSVLFRRGEWTQYAVLKAKK